MTALAAFAAVMLALVARADAQDARADEARFEAATIRIHERSSGAETTVRVAPGQFRATNVSLRDLVELGYGVPHPLGRVRIVGGPSWLDDQRFDVVAKARDGSPAPELPAALRSLLTERFQLSTHREERVLPIYALMTAGDDASSRPGLVRSSTDCAHVRSDPPPALADPATPPPCVLMHTPGRLAGTGITISSLISNGFSRVADDRVIVDRTELAGTFDVHLEWTPEQKEMRLPPLGTPGASFAAVGPPDGPSFFTALREQAGLRLQPSTDSVDVLIDRADRPSVQP